MFDVMQTSHLHFQMQTSATDGCPAGLGYSTGGVSWLERSPMTQEMGLVPV